jgi:hypothetical protein
MRRTWQRTSFFGNRPGRGNRSTGGGTPGPRHDHRHRPTRRRSVRLQRRSDFKVPDLRFLGAINPDLVHIGGEWWRLATAPLVHGGWLHIIPNCVALYRGGRFIERHMGGATVAGMTIGRGLCARFSVGSYYARQVCFWPARSGARQVCGQARPRSTRKPCCSRTKPSRVTAASNDPRWSLIPAVFPDPGRSR